MPQKKLMIRPSIYEFDHHAEFLRESFKFKKSGNKAFSYAYFAKRLKISLSYLKNVVGRKHPLSLDLVNSLSKVLGLSVGEQRYLALLLVRDQVADEPTKKYFEKILISLKAHSQYGFESTQHFEKRDITTILQDEILHLLFSLVPLKDFRPDADWMKGILSDPGLSETEIQSQFDRLVREGAVEIKNGRYVQVENSLNMSGVFGEKVYDIHRVGLAQVHRSLDQGLYRPRIYTMLNLTVNDEDAERIFTLQTECTKKIHAIACESQNPTRVLAMSNNLITLAIVPDPKKKSDLERT